jgi:FMN phosphatase YigB (HAD superfamily)
MIRAIIFDLDNCVSPSDSMGRDFMDPVFAAIREANRGHVGESELASAFGEMWRVPLDAVAKKYGFSDEMLAAGWRVSRELEVRNAMSGYDDVDSLRDLPLKRYLVTSGFRRIQESKIRALGIAPLFDETHVDAIDEPGRRGKEGLFREIAAEGSFAPGEVLVVGDHPESEIAAGNRLGMPTVQILRPGVVEGTTAKFVISSFRDLPGILSRLKQ